MKGLVGCLLVFVVMLEKVLWVVFFDVVVVFLGEIGIGKELVVYVIYESSGCEDGLFVVVDCVGMIEMFFESELFGYERGVFIGVMYCK